MKSLISLFSVLVFTSSVVAQETLATLYLKVGVVEVKEQSGSWQEIERGYKFRPNQTVRTGVGAKAGIRFSSGYITRLNEQTTFEFEGSTAENDKVSLKQGKAYFFSRKPNRYPVVDTPQVSASIRGTEVAFSVDSGSTEVSVLQGAATVSSQGQSVALGQMEKARANTGQPPTKLVLVDRVGEVQWAINYPVIDERAASLINAGRVPEAISLLKDDASATALGQLALLYITLGRDSDARKVLEVPGHHWALSYARSYLAQADTDLEAAMKHAEEALRLNPQSNVALTRVAEVTLFFADYDAALDKLGGASGYYADYLKGFSNLLAGRREQAVADFDSSLAENPTGYAYLGRGLAEINGGSLAKGREYLELAAANDPQVAVFRSYLGKAWFEEEKEDLASEEYAQAIALDSEDPTAYLYRAFLKLSQRNPIGALKDIERSIDSNDNRAVYRSSLLLDSDSAARSTSLGRVYRTLGFNELARVEALKSLNKDYTNYSAHYLLADLYRDTHLNDRVQTTENLIGRLLAPVTFNAATIDLAGEGALNEYTTLFDRPAQKTEVSAEYNTELGAAGWQVDYTNGGSDASLSMGYVGLDRSGFRDNDENKFHQVFSQGQIAVGEKSIALFDAAVGFEERGDIVVDFDPNEEDPDFQRDIDSVLLRTGFRQDLDPGESVIVQLFYNLNQFEDSDRRVTTRFPLFEVTNNGVSTSDMPFSFDGTTFQESDVDQHLVRGDLQYIKKGEELSLVAGAGMRWEGYDSEELGVVTSPGSAELLEFIRGFTYASDAFIDQLEVRTYAYGTAHLTDWADFTAGLSFAYVDLSSNTLTPPFVSETTSETSFDPKAGLLLTPWDGTTIRASFTQTLGRTERGAVGPIEPTFVGGFNQVYDGVAGSEQTLYGIGIDQKICDFAYAGASYVRRELDFNLPVYLGSLSFDLATQATSVDAFPEDESGGADIDTANFYLYTLLGERFTHSIELDIERFEEEFPFPETQTVIVGQQVNYFDPSGFFAFFSADFRNQERGGGVVPKGEEDFWILDAGAGYTFAKRRGSFVVTLLNLTDEEYLYSPITDESFITPGFGAEFAFNYRF